MLTFIRRRLMLIKFRRIAEEKFNQRKIQFTENIGSDRKKILEKIRNELLEVKLQKMLITYLDRLRINEHLIQMRRLATN